MCVDHRLIDDEFPSRGIEVQKSPPDFPIRESRVDDREVFFVLQNSLTARFRSIQLQAHYF
jgi:hypothetical protein